MDEKEYFNIISEYKLLAKHEVGQNFLADPSVANKIVGLANLASSDKVLEIGSGAGSLSYFIARSGASATLIDIDPGLVIKLQGDFSENPNVKVEQANALKYDLSSFNKIIGNLPYYITSSLIERLLLNGISLSEAVLMVQKEAYVRLAAKVGSKDYGPLPILLAYLGTTKKEFDVYPASFVPAPHVSSTVFTISFDKKADGVTAARLYKLTSALFLHRRKTVLNNLSFYLGDSAKAKEVLSLSHTKENERPEDISLQSYLSLLSLLN